MSVFDRIFGESFELRFEKKVNEGLRKKIDEQDDSLAKLKAQKHQYEYFKRVLYDADALFLKVTLSKNGRFAVVKTKQEQQHREIWVYLEEEDWAGGDFPRAACKLKYTQDDGHYFIDEIESDQIEKGAGSIAMECLLEIATNSKIDKIKGDLACQDLERNKDRLIGFYTKYNFEITLYEKSADLGGDVYKAVN